MADLFGIADENVCVFVDGANTFAACKALGYSFDYELFVRHLRHQGVDVLRAYFYTAIKEDEFGHDPLRKMVDRLSFNGFSMRTKEAKTYVNAGVTKIKGNMDIELCVDVMRLAAINMKHAILFSGDGDFRALVEAVQNMGVKVTVVSTIETSPIMCSDLLRKQADQFVDLAALQPAFDLRR